MIFSLNFDLTLIRNTLIIQKCVLYKITYLFLNSYFSNLCIYNESNHQIQDLIDLFSLNVWDVLKKIICLKESNKFNLLLHKETG